MDTKTENKNLLENSSFFRECIAERDAIAAHRRQISEGNEAEISFEEALVDWMLKKRDAWRANRQRTSSS